MTFMKFEEKLAMLCEDKGWNQSRLTQAVAKAAQLTLSKNTVSRWFSGAVRPYDPWFLPLARTLGVSADYLADDALDEPPAPSLTEDEAAVLDLVRALGLDRHEALRRLAGAERPVIEVARPGVAQPPTPPAKSGWVGPQRDETEADIRRERERNRPVKVQPKAGRPAEAEEKK